MTDLTPTLNSLLSKHGTSTCAKPTTKTADEFLKEAYRIVSQRNAEAKTPSPRNIYPNKTIQNYHITSLLHYLQTIRHAYLSTTPQRRNANAPTSQPTNPTLPPTSQTLTDPERDTIDTQTSLLLRDLATSLTNLSSAETLRQETEQTLLRKKYGHSAASALLFRWAGGKGVTDETGNEGKSAEQVTAEERARALKTVREGVLWFLRRGLEGVVGVQRGLVEKRIERVREKEKSVLYKVAAGRDVGGSANAGGRDAGRRGSEKTGGYGSGTSFDPSFSAPDASTLSEADTARIEAQLSPEQLQLFAEENDTMLRHYEDTLGKVQYVFYHFPIFPFLFLLVFSVLTLFCIEMRRNHSSKSHLCKRRSLRILLRRRNTLHSLFRMLIRRR
jgi:hypothetical protein